MGKFVESLWMLLPRNQQAGGLGSVFYKNAIKQWHLHATPKIIIDINRGKKAILSHAAFRKRDSFRVYQIPVLKV